MGYAMKRLMVVLLAALAAGFAWAGSYTDSNNVTWTSSGGAITDVSVKKGTLTMPAEIDGVTITGFGTIFKGASDLVNITIPAGVTKIEASAFSGCSNLRSVTFAAGSQLTSIGNYAFSSTGLTSFTMPDTVTYLGEGTFSYCTALKTVSISDGVEVIRGTTSNPGPGNSLFDGHGTFYGCTALTTINWGSSVKTVMKGAFYNCSSLKTVTIPDTVESIGDYAFGGCSSLVTLTIGEGVTQIGYQAFYGLSKLVNLTFGASVEDIGESAFNGCTNLKPFTLPNTLQTLGPWCFASCSKALTTVAIPTNKDGVTITVGEGCFAYDTSLKSVSLGDTYEVIRGTTSNPGPGNSLFDGHGTFYGCTALTTIDWGSSVKTVMKGAFYGCSSLAVVDLPSSVEYIGDYAFAADKSLRQLSIPGNLTYLGAYAFGDCTALHYIDFRGNADPPSVGSNPFNNTKTRMVIYANADSTGWTGVTSEVGFPSSGTWQGRTITERPPSANAGNPYDFYPYTRTDRISSRDYAWPAPVMITTNRYVTGKTVPASVTTIREGDPIYLSYAFDEYWRGEAFAVTNRFTLSGAKSDTFEYGNEAEAHGTWAHWWTTNAVPDALQNLAPGNYTLTLQLNAGNRLKETDYANNSTSITFTVVGVPKFTVAFNLNGAPGTAPATRMVFEGNAVGELPEATWSGRTFLGWYVGNTRITATTPVTANMTCMAKWQSYDIIFWKPLDMSWKDTMFVSSSSYANEMQTTFKVGDPIYFYYACYEADAQTLRTSFVNRFSLTGDNGVSKIGLYHNISGIYSGTCEGVYGTKVDALQGLAAGTYTFTCTLDADKNVVESNEGNNTKTITFTVVPTGTTFYTVTFNANGGSGGTTRQVASGSAVGTLPTPTRGGHSFVGWFTAATGGTQISASTKVNANVTYYAHWTQNGGGGSGEGGGSGGGSGEGGGSGGGVYQPGEPMPVTYVINNNTYYVTVIVGQAWGNDLPAAPTAPAGQTFAGWYTGKSGTGMRVTATSIVPDEPVTLYPHFVAKETHWLYASVVGAMPTAAASEYNGYLYDTGGNVKGTIQVKAGKPNKKTGLAAVKATVVGLDGRKITLKAADSGKAFIASSGPTTISLVGGEACAVMLGAEGLYGRYGAYSIDGARNFFTSKDKAEQTVANAILAKWLDSVNVVWNGGSVNVAPAKNGKAKVKGTLADGKTKISVNAVFLIGAEWCCVPVVAPRANLGFATWLSRDGNKVAVEGLGTGVLAGKSGVLAANAKFRIPKAASVWAQAGKPLTGYLPDGVAVSQSGTRWVVAGGAKAGKLAMKGGVLDDSKAGANPSGLKLTYKAKDGSFKGSFKAYADVGGKLKATTVNVTGVMVNGVGHGTATVKGVGSVSVEIK